MTVADKVAQASNSMAKQRPDSSKKSETRIELKKMEEAKVKIDQRRQKLKDEKEKEKESKGNEIITFPDNSTYEGPCKDSVPDGEGKMRTL